MKRIDLLIQLVTDIYKLLKSHLGSPCGCSAPVENTMENRFDPEEGTNLVQILKSIDRHVRVSNELAVDRHNANTTQDRFLDSADIYQRFKFGRTKLYQLKKEGVLKAYKLGGKDYFLESEVVKALMEAGGA